MEHMVLMVPNIFPKMNWLTPAKTGVDFGADLNAYTSFDETVYILSFPTEIQS
jgi:zinc protease